MRDIWARFFQSTFHLNNKFLQMAWTLLIPGKVTLDFFQGKIKRYPHPLQFFFVVMFFFLLALNHGVQEDETQEKQTFDNGKSDLQFDLSGGKINGKKVNIMKELANYTKARELQQAYDSLPADYKSKTSAKAVDSIISQVYHHETNIFKVGTLASADSVTLNDSISEFNELDSLNFNFFAHSVKVASADIVNLEPDEIFQRYNITEWRDKVLIKQGLKAITSPEGLKKSLLGSLSWTILALISAMSGFLALLYWRQHRFFVEHFVFLLHQQTSVMLILTLLLLLKMLLAFSLASLMLAGVALIGMHSFVAMKRFYQQGWLKTIFKWLLFTLFYSIGFAVFFLIGLIVVFLVF
ncbi:MAG: DUF3667 domain-containing protein [Lewinellaceae bacterium]|nr:DUF3667 domain-containing protein [Lewinellaceae bacterium]